MAPLNPNRTNRLTVRYTSYAIQHDLLFRFPTDATATEALNTIDPVLVALATIMRPQDSFFEARWSVAGSNLSFPIPFNPIEGTGTGAAAAGDYQSRFASFVGRDAIQGRRVRYDFFTASASLPAPDSNRIQLGDNETIDNIHEQFVAAANNATADPPLVTIGENNVVFNGYVNVAFSAYWQRRQRRFGNG